MASNEIIELYESAKAIIAKVAKAQIEEKYGSVANAITEACKKPCETCGGSRKCPVCKGTGQDPTAIRMCWKCGGKGVCPDCKKGE